MHRPIHSRYQTFSQGLPFLFTNVAKPACIIQCRYKYKPNQEKYCVADAGYFVYDACYLLTCPWDRECVEFLVHHAIVSPLLAHIAFS